MLRIGVRARSCCGHVASHGFYLLLPYASRDSAVPKRVKFLVSDSVFNPTCQLPTNYFHKAFVPARKLGGSGKKVEVQMKDGTRTTVAESDLKKLNRASLKRVVADLTLLDDMVPPLILHNLKERFARKEIYTNVGTILISVNPYVAMLVCLFDGGTCVTVFVCQLFHHELFVCLHPHHVTMMQPSIFFAFVAFNAILKELIS